MLRWPFLSISFFLVIGALAEVPQKRSSSFGVRSQQEAKLLWKDGRKAFELGQLQKAASLFQRLVDRYPGNPGYLEAHYLLGKTYFLSSNCKDAVPPLSHYIGAHTYTPQSLDSRLLLARCKLLDHKYEEALLISEEVLKNKDKIGSALDPVTLTSFWLLKIESLHRNGQNKNASLLLESLLPELETQSPKPLLAHGKLLEMRLKLDACVTLNAKVKISEATTRQRMGEWGECLNEATVLFYAVVQNGEPTTIDLATTEITQSFRNYITQCQKPPKPLAKLTKIEFNRYRSELSDILIQDSKLHLANTLALTRAWKNRFDGSKKEKILSFVSTIESLSK